eukprot:TRINITY_DN968_c0_g1_i1.p1 TRINITY_DN968_c0_g1~~TRINITY_DN968_c0_g1_i1.p1  ORF type:complete len:189 (+),score=76.46 TRINITY_DN968_c0_g1_i1:58-624(+)
MSHGKSQTEKLKKQLEEQLNRLLKQLEDCEELKDMMEPDEYETTKKETLEQMQDFSRTLQKMMSGDVSLVSELGSVRLAMQAAVSQAFKTPEVIKLFARKQPAQLRQRLATLQRDAKLKGIPQDVIAQQAVEILVALKKLGEELTPAEAQYLSENASKALADFETVSEGDVGAGLLSSAGSQIAKAQK